MKIGLTKKLTIILTLKKVYSQCCFSEKTATKLENESTARLSAEKGTVHIRLRVMTSHTTKLDLLQQMTK